MSAPAAAHVVMDGDTFCCRHCGSRYRMALPVELTVWLAACSAFLAAHAACLAPQPAGAGDE